MESSIKSQEKRDEFYDSKEWKDLAEAHKEAFPKCCVCLLEGKTKDVDVTDHIISVKKDPLLALVSWNLQSLCYKHYNSKSAAER